MWRNDSRCGTSYPLPNGTAAQCDPDGENPCCSDWWDGECGNTTEHCFCYDCRDYKFEKWWRETAGTQMWRNDGKCGRQIKLPNGEFSQCDPDGEKPCCSDWWDGECGNTAEHCSCYHCTDYKFNKWWRESGGTQMWRNDGKCGIYYPLPNGAAAQCDPDGENPCCSDAEYGECGDSNEHCFCGRCTNFSRLYREWRISGGLQNWRHDGKCGELYLLPNNAAAQCDPDGENPCCSHMRIGKCGNTTEHCSCYGCTDYKFAKWWRESGGTQLWRNDGKCGRHYPLPNGTAAECDPDGKNPCCSSRWDGECGNTTEHCSCYGCTDYKFAKWWRESGGTQLWRNDGKCGRHYPLPNGTAAECDPDGKNPCCSSSWYGECGNTTEHCSCYDCTNYKFAKWWRESGGTQMWRNDGKCGDWYPLPNGTAAECDPDGENPCCSSGWNGECGKSREHCDWCIDYSRIYGEWRMSGGLNKWRYDYKCGEANPLPDGTAAQCDPDGGKPCCSDRSDGECGNTTEHCSCRGCTDYNFIQIWRESGGTQMWRNDGKCGRHYPLPNGEAAQCDPDGKTPCCSWREGVCSSLSDENCFCDDCINFKLVKELRISGINCTIVRLESGFLQNVCFNETSGRMNFKCPYSDVHFGTVYIFSESKVVTEVCENDPFVYQACGLNKRITGPDVLCRGYFCATKTSWTHGGYEAEEQPRYVHKLIECQSDDCKADSRDCSTTRDDLILCNDKCDHKYCSDESNCNGYMYKQGHPRYLANLDFNMTNETVSTCTDYSSKVLEGEEQTVQIFNGTRCLVLDLKDRINNPYCLDYLDQTNCSDIERVGGYCKVNGFMSSVSKYVLCHGFDKTANLPVKICDDDFQNECVYPSTKDCQIHKHKLCDGMKDCSDTTDEIHDMCETMSDVLSFTCTRSFNPIKGKTSIPLSWIKDGITDCMNGEDEDSDRWEFCRGTFRQILLPGQKCQDVFKCPGDNESYVPFDKLCDGVESCDNGGENKVCRIARDFPLIDKMASYYSSARNVCASSDCEIRDFKSERDLVEIFGVFLEQKLLVPTLKRNCSDLFGEYYLFLSCMDLCLEKEAVCPLDVVDQTLRHNSCPGQFPDRTYTLANNSFITFVVESDTGHYHQEFFQCNNSRCIEYQQVCDLVDDCGDMSDEINCTNHMICEDTRNSSKHQFIALSQKCDGIYDCFDLSDECNANCGREILGNWFLKIVCWFMGILALLFNLFTSVNGFVSLKNCQTKSMMTSKALMSIIGSGDFLIGLYLVILSVYDSFMFGEEFCKHQAEWLTGKTCLTLGVISTLGSQISLFTMTVLSVIRLYGLTCKSMRFPGPVHKRSILKLTILSFTTVAAAVAIAVIPLVPALEDLFVQGIYYEPSYKVFVGFPNKERHMKILQSYYDHNETFNGTSIPTKISWKEIEEKVDGMFTQNEGILTRSPVHFYGNDGLCLFKYFVRTDDARKSRQSLGIQSEIKDPVVWTMLAVNLFCFIVITCCYIVITWKTKQSSQRSGQSDNEERQKNERAIQNKIMIIIATDFLCWVPFIVISALHNLAYIDASEWYSTFAMTVLPLNSVINPLVYDKALGDLIRRLFERVKQFLGKGTSPVRRLTTESFWKTTTYQGEEPEVVTINRICAHRNQVAKDDDDDDDLYSNVDVKDINGEIDENVAEVKDNDDEVDDNIADAKDIDHDDMDRDNFNEIEI